MRRAHTRASLWKTLTLVVIAASIAPAPRTDSITFFKASSFFAAPPRVGFLSRTPLYDEDSITVMTSHDGTLPVGE